MLALIFIMAKKKSKSTPENRAALETSQTAEIAWYTTEFQDHPTIGMTPQRLHQLLTAAEQGNLTAQADLGADMEERDGHIFSELDKRKKGVNSLPWGMKPPKNASPLEKKITEEVYEWIDDIEDLEMIFFDAMDGLGHGYSGQEIQWERVGKLWLPTSFEHSNARNFQTPVNAPNELRLRDGSVDGAEFWDFNWFIHHHKAKSGYISRRGLHRVLSWPFLFKNYSVRDVLEFLEIYGLPLRVGKYPSGATADEKNTLLRAVMSIGRNAGGIIPNGMMIDFESAATGDTDNHMSFIKWCEQVQSKVIVGGTLLSQADGKTSTNAQGQVHAEQFQVLIKSDAKQLARSFNDSVITYIMRLNYPTITPDRYPKFYFETADTEDIQTFSDALPKLVGVGMKIPLAWAHDKLGIPQPEDNSVAILGAPQPQPKPKLAANTKLFQAALSQAPLMPDSVPYDQLILDQFIKSANLDSGQVAQDWTGQLIAAIQAKTNSNELLALLSEMNPEADEPMLQDMLTKLIFAADVFARLAEQAEHE